MTTNNNTTNISFFFLLFPCLAARRGSHATARRRMRVRARARDPEATMTVARVSDRRPLGARRDRVDVRGRNNPR